MKSQNEKLLSSNELISVIIPVYNVEKFIERCVYSLLNQDYRNFEIILVDDGSPDDSPALLDNLKKKDSRIVVIHKCNGGVSSARNAGLEVAKGSYVLFVDGDDWVEPDYISWFYRLIKIYNCDIAMSKRHFSDRQKKSLRKEYIISAEKAIQWIYLGNVFMAVWNKIYKKSFLLEHSIAFDETIWYGEGMLFNIDCLQYTDKVAIGEKSVYHQTSNPNSAMRKFSLESNFCGIRSLEIQKDHWRKKSSSILRAWKYHRYAFNWSIMRGLAQSGQDKDYAEIYNDCAKNLKHDFLNALIVPISMRNKLLYIRLAMNPYRIANKLKIK